MTILAPDFQRKRAERNGGHGTDNVVPITRLQRSFGEAKVAFKTRGGKTVLSDVEQSGCCKVRFPTPEPGAASEAVLINTAGGLTDGDHVSTSIRWGADTCASITTQAAERIYRSRGQQATITNTILAEDGATALWLPQETILFDGGRFVRRLDASVAEGARLLACESTIFGRTAMGETVGSGELFDSWRIRYGGKLVFADGLRLVGDIDQRLGQPALANGAKAIASVVCVDAQAESLVEPVRAALEQRSCVTGCSVIGPVLVVRLLGVTGCELRRDQTALLEMLLERLGSAGEDRARAAMPRAWSC